MVSPLLNSSVDVVRLILAYLSRSDLCALCLTNPALRELAEPILYTNIQLTWRKSQTPPIIPLLQRILHNPKLANCVRTIVLDGDDIQHKHGFYDFHSYKPESPKIAVSETDLNGLVDCIARTDVPYSDLWIQELHAGTVDAFAALLLSRLPGLRRLQLGENFTRKSRFIGMMLRSALCEERKDNHLPLFKYLQDVAFAYFEIGARMREYTDIRNTTDILTLFYLPSVKHITAMIDNPATFTWPTAQPPNASSLESLDLTLIREGNLGQLLSATSRLKKLRWEWYYREDLKDLVTTTIDHDQIAADLFHVRETLTDLSIRGEVCPWIGDTRAPIMEVRGNFQAVRDLDKLRTLCVPLPILLGFSPSDSDKRLEDVLPKNIEYLTINDDFYDREDYEWMDLHLMEALESWWLGDRRKSTPHLKKFHLFLGIIDFGEWDPEMRQRLRDLGVQAGIQVEITKKNGEM
ncbi:hypothetical protein FQN49_000229 [Arthroderma sp. PD_2]|nr:hypothetical protein FQN49_000229 [Arthroderma sp. PD_2]